MSLIIEEKEARERLLRNVKKECKQLMEVAVTKKFIHEDNGCITSLCASIEACLLHGLKKISIFQTNTTLSLLQKISRHCQDAEKILKMCEEYDKAFCNNTSNHQHTNNSQINVSQSEKSSFSLFSRKYFTSTTSIDNTQVSLSLPNTNNAKDSSIQDNFNTHSFSPTYYKGSNCYRFLWIRIALLNKCLTNIIDYIINNSSKYYAPYSLMLDPVDGPIFSSLLIGPCTLEYTRMKTCDYLWSDPNADELIQRHKMHSSAINTNNNQNLSFSALMSIKKKLGLNTSIYSKRKVSVSGTFEDLNNTKSNNSSLGSFKSNNTTSLPKNQSLINSKDNSSSKSKFFSNKTLPTINQQASLSNNASTPMITNSQSFFSSSSSAREYVESLHQNSKSQLIYGKNHVIVRQKDKEFAGYLSLHINSTGLILKWTPNQLMNSADPCDDADTSSPVSSNSQQNLPKTQSGYWEFAMAVDMNTIVYLHCHQQSTLVLVAPDGVQYPPIKFPKGSHLLQFLTCLENGLAPYGQLDPPLWNEIGKGKVFPKLQKRSTTKDYKKQKLVCIEKQNNILSLTTEENQNCDLSDGDKDTRNFSSVNNVENWSEINKGETSKEYLNENNSKINISDSTSENSFNINENSTNDEVGGDDYNMNGADDFVFRIINKNSNVLVKPVDEEVQSNITKKETTISFADTTTNQLTFITPSAPKNGLSEKFFKSIFSPFSSTSKSPRTPFNSSTESLNDKFLTTSFDSSQTGFSKRPNAPPPVSPNSSFDSANESNSYLISSKTPTFDSKTGFLGLPYSISSELNFGNSNRMIRSISVRSSLKVLCDSMKKQILSRAFYGWLTYHRYFKTVSLHLTGLINCDHENKCLEDKISDDEQEEDKKEESVQNNIHDENQSSSQTKKIKPKSYLINKKKLDEELWSYWIEESLNGTGENLESKLKSSQKYFYEIIYYNGIESSIRKKVWPYLFDHYSLDMNTSERELKDKQTSENYFKLIDEWKQFETHINLKEEQTKYLFSKMNLLNANSAAANNSNLKTITKTESAKSESEEKIQEIAISLNRNEKIPKTSFFGNFSSLKSNKSAPMISLDNKTKLVREASNSSNEVFIDESNINQRFSLLRNFSAKNLFAKLMQRSANNQDDSDTQSINSNKTIIEENFELDDQEEYQDESCESELKRKEIAKQLVDEIINKIQNDFLVLKTDETNSSINSSNDESKKLDRENSAKSSSIYCDCSGAPQDSQALFSSESYSSLENNDESYHECQEIESNEVLEEKMNNDKKSESKAMAPSIEIHVDSNEYSIRKTLSNIELINQFALNMHRIDKDVTRCDRNYWYFTSNDNLKKLKNIVYTYVWENLNIGYIQGMCDLVAPLLVLLDDEPLVYSCFKQLMKRMSFNFPHGTAMDQNFSNMKTLIQILDTDLFEHMQQHGDYTHFYFTYRWFLLDFKRELVYDDVFAAWETIWAAKKVISAHFYLFIALALVETYRDIIIDNNMDFTDIIKFFNEMAEKHKTSQILNLARNLIQQLKNLIDKKNDKSLDQV